MTMDLQNRHEWPDLPLPAVKNKIHPAQFPGQTHIPVTVKERLHTRNSGAPAVPKSQVSVNQSKKSTPHIQKSKRKPKVIPSPMQTNVSSQCANRQTKVKNLSIKSHNGSDFPAIPLRNRFSLLADEEISSKISDAQNCSQKKSSKTLQQVINKRSKIKFLRKKEKPQHSKMSTDQTAEGYIDRNKIYTQSTNNFDNHSLVCEDVRERDSQFEGLTWKKSGFLRKQIADDAHEIP